MSRLDWGDPRADASSHPDRHSEERIAMRNWLMALVAVPLMAHAAGPAEEVRCAEVRFSLSVEAQDLDAFRLLIDPDARFTGADVLRGPDAIVAAWGPFFAPDGPRIAWRPRVVEVLESGDLALTRGPYRLESPGQDGNTEVRWGTFNSVWRRGPDGRWRVVFDAGGPPAGSATEESETLLAAPTDDCVQEQQD
jgi:ketosteroid isomerase-like protein